MTNDKNALSDCTGLKLKGRCLRITRRSQLKMAHDSVSAMLLKHNNPPFFIYYYWHLAECQVNFKDVARAKNWQLSL